MQRDRKSKRFRKAYWTMGLGQRTCARAASNDVTI
jgi:hypothetical protein